jgi:hypothetical protein
MRFDDEKNDKCEQKQGQSLKHSETDIDAPAQGAR